MADLEDEDLMKRFLVGDVSSEERDRIEERFIHDHHYVESLAALEEEILLSYRRGDLSPDWRDRVERHLGRSEAAARGLRQLDGLRDALGAAAAVQTRTARVDNPRRWGPFLWGSWGPLVAGSAAVVAIVIGGWWIRGRSGAPEPATVPIAQEATKTGTVAILRLHPDLVRAPGTPSNSLRVPPDADRVRLELTVPTSGATALDATLRPVGRDPLPITTRPDIRVTETTIEVNWIVPSKQLPVGDYILTLDARTSEQARTPVATRVFSIVE